MSLKPEDIEYLLELDDEGSPFRVVLAEIGKNHPALLAKLLAALGVDAASHAAPSGLDPEGKLIADARIADRDSWSESAREEAIATRRIRLRYAVEARDGFQREVRRLDRVIAMSEYSLSLLTQEPA